MRTAQDFPNINFYGSAMSGFNRRIYGEARYDNRYPDREIMAGWNLANDMILAGKIFYIQQFPHRNCHGHAFQYGGHWVCNTCCNQDVDRPWWEIKVYQDGNAWCCVGAGFEDLQESDNYAFGATREEAIRNYGELMLSRDAAQSAQQVNGK